MADEVRLWEVNSTDDLVLVEPAKLDKEDRIEKWILKDISVLDPEGAGLLVIGEQVLTAYGKKIDLLCIDSDGNLVVVELKRDLTPREVTAQALDYASWVKTLGAEEIERIAAEHLHKSLGEAFEAAFDSELPDTINAEHSIKIVASNIDDSTERIVRYLSEGGIDINVIRFNMFQTKDGRQLLLRTFTVALEEAEQNIRKGTKSKRTTTYKTLDVRLAESTNQAQSDFLTQRMAENHLMNKRKTALVYRINNTNRWYVRPKKDHAHVVQIGRFPGDDLLWHENLSNAHVGLRRHGANLGFRLYTPPDFQFFHSTVSQQGEKLLWSSIPFNGAGAGDDEEEGEE